MRPQVELSTTKFRNIRDLMFAVSMAEVAVGSDDDKLLDVYKRAIIELQDILGVIFYHLE